jgi:hypothetical protein
MTKQDRAMRFSRRSLSNSLLEGSTCRVPLGQRNGGLFSTFGHFPDSLRTLHIFVILNWHVYTKQLNTKLLQHCKIWSLHENSHNFEYGKYVYNITEEHAASVFRVYAVQAVTIPGLHEPWRRQQKIYQNRIYLTRKHGVISRKTMFF